MALSDAPIPRGWDLLTQERPRPDAVRRRPWAWRLAVATVCFGAFMGQLDASIVTLTYQALGTSFHASPAAIEWVSLAYLLTLVALLVPVGRFSDVHGRKLMYLYGFGVFTVASAACGLAPGLAVLVVFRIVQALGAALMQANSVALVTTSAPAARMRTALGTQAAGQAVGLALGPTVGGAIVATLGWRWVFLVNLPVGIFSLVAGHYLLPRTRRAGAAGGTGVAGGTGAAAAAGAGARTGSATAAGVGARREKPAERRIDGWGVALLALTTTGLLLAISVLSGLGWPLWTALVAVAVALLSGRGLLRRQERGASPLVDLALLRSNAPGLLGGFCGYLVLFGPLVLVPVELARRGVGVFTAGLALTALPLGFALAATSADRLLPARLDDASRARLGAAISVLGLGLLTVLPMTVTLLPLSLLVVGIGLGVFTPANNTMVMRAFPTESAGTGGGMVNMGRGLGTSVGVAVVTLVLHLAPGASGGRLAAAALLGFGVLLSLCARAASARSARSARSVRA